MRGRVALLSLACVVASCAPARQGLSPAEAATVFGNPAVSSVPLADRARAQIRRPFAEQRTVMAAQIRADVREAAPSADTPAFERALAIVARLQRERFVLPAGRRFAYIDTPQQIGWQ